MQGTVGAGPGGRSVIAACAIVAAVLLAGCGLPGEAAPRDQVTVRLKWVHQAQFAGFYAADIQGFYKEEGIDVSLQPGGTAFPPGRIVDDLVAGESDFAIIGGDQLLLARSRGEPIVAVAVVFRENPYVYVTLRSAGIERPEDLVGKRVMVPGDAEVLHQALLQKMDIAAAGVETVAYDREIDPLLQGDADAQLVYRTGLGLTFEETDEELNWMWMEDYGIQFYADTIVTREALVEDDPDLINRFLAATLRGWRYTIEHPDEAVDMTLRYDPTLNAGREARMMEAQTPLIHSGEVPIGWMRPDVWQAMHDLLLEHGILERRISLEKAYTTGFLPRDRGRGE